MSSRCASSAAACVLALAGVQYLADESVAREYVIEVLGADVQHGRAERLEVARELRLQHAVGDDQVGLLRRDQLDGRAGTPNRCPSRRRPPAGT